MLVEHDAGLFDGDLFRGDNHLMVDVLNIDTQRFELMDKSFHFFFMRIPSHIAELFVVSTSQDEIDRSSESIGNGDFGLISRAETKDEFVVFGSVESSSLHLGPMSRLNEDFSQVGVARTAF